MENKWKKKIIYNEKQKKIYIYFWCIIFEGLLPSLCCDRKARQQARVGALGRRRACWGAGERAGARAGRAWGAQVVAGHWALGERARGMRGALGKSGRRARSRRTLGRGAAGARQQRTGRAGQGRQARGQAWRGRAAERTVCAGHGRPGCWMGAQAGPVLVHCAPGPVLARFLDPVRLGIFLSHQMNTVHCKINF